MVIFMMKFTREDLQGMGMPEAQIENILKRQEEKCEEEVSTSFKHAEHYTESDITSVSDIVKFTAGSIVRLPDFSDGQPFIAKLKRPSMLVLMKSGKIPNSLLNQATQLFKSGAGALGEGSGIDDLYDIMEIILGEAMVEPKYSELKDAGVQLSDDQMMAIFSYTQQGVKALENFR